MDKEMKRIIENNYAALASCVKNKPHVIMVACIKVKGGRLIITDNYMKTTLFNIKRNRNVGLVVCDGKKGYSIDGKVKYYSSGKWLEFVKSLKENRGMPAKGAIVFEIVKIRGLA